MSVELQITRSLSIRKTFHFTIHYSTRGEIEHEHPLERLIERHGRFRFNGDIRVLRVP